MRNTKKNHNNFKKNFLRVGIIVVIGVVGVFSLLMQPVEAVVEYKSASQADNGSGATSLTINTPSGATVGDVLVVTLSYKPSNNPSKDMSNFSGWTCPHQTNSSTVLWVVTCYRVLTATPPSSYNFEFRYFETSITPYSTRAAGGMVALSGVNTANPLNKSQARTNTSNTTLTAPSVTTTVPNAMIYTGYGTAVFTSVTAGSGMTERFDIASSGGGNNSVKVTAAGQTALQASAGASGTKTMTAANAAVNIGHTLAFAPITTQSQDDYRWFSNTNSTTPGSPLASQNTAAIADSSGVSRLQMLISPTSGQIDSSNKFYLQYAARGNDGVCDANFVNEIYANLAPLQSDIIYASSSTQTLTETGQISWQDPANAVGAPNNTLTQVNLDFDKTSYALRLAGYSSSIPSGATITGVEVLSRGAYGFNKPSLTAQLTVSGSPAGSTLGLGLPNVLDGEDDGSAGGAHQKWGLNLTPAQFNSGQIGVSIRAFADIGTSNVAIDSVGLKVYYTDNSATARFHHNPLFTGNYDSAVNGGLTSSKSITAAQYAEYHEFSTYLNRPTIETGQTGLWDFPIDTSSLSPGTYCFRVVSESGTPLASYQQIPTLTIPSPNYTQSSYRFYENVDSVTPGAPLAAQDTAVTVAPEVPFRLRQLVAGSTGVNAGKNFVLQYGEKVTTCSAASYQNFVGSIENWPQLVRDYDYEDYGYPNYWSNLSEVRAKDGSSARVWVGSAMGGSVSNPLTLSDFGFSIPSNATIQGLQINATVASDTLYTQHIGASTVNLSSVSGAASKGGTSYAWNYSSLTDITYGGPTDLWGTTMTPTQINNLSFNLTVEGTSFSSTAVGLLDSISARVFYSLPGSSEEILFQDNSSVTSGAAISTHANDPVESGATNIPQTYSEEATISTVSGVSAAQRAMWDFSLNSTPAAHGKTYCFRVVNNDNSNLNTYQHYPEVMFGTPPSSGPTLEQRMRGGQSVIDGVKRPLGWD